MRLLCVTDLHGALDALAEILGREPAPDAIVLGGDLTNFGTPGEAALVVDRCESVAPVVAVAGNCDSAAIDALLAERGVSVHGAGRVLGGAGFFGVSAMPPWMGNMYEFTEEEIDAFLARGHAAVADAAPLVLVSHPPPRGLADRTRRGDAVGSTSVRAWVDRARPALVICGHIHEARGVARAGPTVVVNCGYARGGSYAVAVLDGERAEVELRRA